MFFVFVVLLGGVLVLKLNVNDIVVYGTTGVCRVDGLTDVKMGREIKQYYVLTPIANASAAVYLPADNEQLAERIHTPLTKAQVEDIINTLPRDKEIWSNNPAERVHLFADALKSGDRGQILLTVRTLILRRRALSAAGKKLHITDERALRDAQRLIFDEVAYAMGIVLDQAEEYVLKSILSEE